MVVTYNGESYTCTTAYKGADYVHLVDAAGVICASFDGISDLSGFAISGGSWTVPCSDDDNKFATVREDGTMVPSAHTYKDILDGKAPTVHYHDASAVTSGTLAVTRGGTGYTTLTDTVYTTVRYRGSGLRSADTNPTANGTINWTYG